MADPTKIANLLARMAEARGSGSALDMSPEASNALATESMDAIISSLNPAGAEAGLAGKIRAAAQARKAGLLQKGITATEPAAEEASKSIYQQGSPVVEYSKKIVQQMRDRFRPTK